MNPKDCRIVFLGTPGFAVESLKALVEKGYQVVGVVTAPDKPAGRGKKLRQSEVKVYAESQGLTILQPEKLKHPDFLTELQKLKANLQIVVAFRMLPKEVWAMPPMGTFNLHASLLPQYRGAAPINWAIINGEKESGVTTFLLKHEIDTGKIIHQVSTPITDDDDVASLHDRLMNIGAQLVCKTVDELAVGTAKLQDQASLMLGKSLREAPKIFKNDCRIDWNQSGESIRNFVRGLSPYPAAWSTLIPKGQAPKNIKIFLTSLEAEKHHKETGTILSDGKGFMKVACIDGWVKILELQLEGKKRMGIGNFLRGFNERIEDYKLS